MKLVVGLGNPGRRYAATRHNVGYRVVEAFAGLHGIALSSRKFSGRFGRGKVDACDVAVLEPETFMNLSGVSVRELVREYEAKPEADLIVLQDELDFPLGTLRIHTRRSSAGHNGIESIIGALGTQDFLRIRMGVAPDRKVEDGESYLLAPMRKADLKVVDGILDAAEQAVKVILQEGPAAAMNRFNRKED